MFQKVRSKRLYEDVVEQFLTMIRDGNLKPGERILPERELQEIVGVSRGVLREAFRVLEARGLVESRPGGGRFLRNLPSHQVLADGTPDLKIEQVAVLEFWEVREALELLAVGLAAHRRRSDEADQLIRLALDFSKQEPATQESIHSDLEFHRAVARASHNLLLERLLSEQIHVAYDMREHVLAWLHGGRRPELEEEDLMEIALAIKNRRVDRAKSRMASHLASARKKYEAPPATSQQTAPDIGAN